jgi:hypothetical protein
MNISDSYRKADCCNEDCAYMDNDDETKRCWGDVQVAEEVYYDDDDDDDDDYGYIHLCEGHIDYYDSGVYIDEDRGSICHM